ncbi:UNVERIFIED_CONTAM: hypothetical protein FKN15_023425 [Acipenser sinensis]
MHSAKTIKQCLIYAVLWTVCAVRAVADPVVSTAYGSLKGKLSSVKGTDRVGHEYLGIPFAKPPLGSLRFSTPQPPEPWSGIRDATNQPPMCIQDMQYTARLLEDVMLDFSVPAISEDCLYLNIYTPGEAAVKEARLPVMVWIHGGGLMIGAASFYDGSALAAYENVVVVVIQYRLGILGFLSTSDEHARGNWGFLDQVAALQWVQENIKSFGGDPNSVTIFGESAGGCSVSVHVLSPLSSGLFHKAISESGVATIHSVITSIPPPINKMVANATGCDYTDSATLVKCLREKNDEVFVNASKLHIMLPGTVDGVFLPSTVEEILKEKRFHKVPYLLGINNHEFGWILPKTMAPPGWEEGMDKEKAIAVLNMMVPVEVLGPGVNERIAAEYFKDTEDPVKLRDLFTEMLGDVFMVLPTIIAANYHKEAGVPVYLYETPNGDGLVHWPVYDKNEEYMALGLEQKSGTKLKGDSMTFLTNLLSEKNKKPSEESGEHSEL